MKVNLDKVSDPLLHRVFASIQRAFERVREYAVVPAGGAAGSVLVKVDGRDYNSTWTAAPTTGAQTATFTATNKPGVASGSPQLWIPVVVGGTTYYLPLFS